MIKDPFGKEELYIAWMRCRYFITQDITNFRLSSELIFYDKYIDQIILDLHYKLRNRQYSFSSKQVFLIPKNNGLLRKKSFMEIEDQIVSHAILNFIGKKIDSKFYYWNCANRILKKKSKFSAPTFIPYFKQYNRFINHTAYKIKDGNRWVCETDIVSYFDHIDHNILIAMLKAYLKDEQYSYVTEILIPTYLNSSYLLKGEIKKSEKGIPQGGALAYFLSNLYLNEVDHKMKGFTKSNYIRYVDDIRIVGKTKTEVEQNLLRLQALLWELGLEINAGKTKIYEAEDGEELKNFYKEQEEKLSFFEEVSNNEVHNSLQKYKDIIEENEKHSPTEGDFKELEKLRNRKINLATNNLIRKGDPTVFPLLMSQIYNKPEKAMHLLGNIGIYRFKEKKLNVIEINNYYLYCPYESYVAVAVTNLYKWKLNIKLDKFIPSETGIVELYLLNNSEEINLEKFILTSIINKIFNKIELANPYLINSIIFHISRSTGAKGKGFSLQFKLAFINRIIETQTYKLNNHGQFIIDAFINDNLLLDALKSANDKRNTEFLMFLKDNYQELYSLLSVEHQSKEIVQPNDGYITLREFHKSLYSLNEAFTVLKELIELVQNNNEYISNPFLINPENIWIKFSYFEGLKIKLNPNPIRDTSLYLSTPEDFFDKSNLKNELKVSYTIGIVIFSLLLKEMNKINDLNLVSLEFNPQRLWKKNNKDFKDIYDKQEIELSPIKNEFYQLLDIIRILTKKNPKTRLSIFKFEDYLYRNKEVKENNSMKFFISHSSKDKGRISPYLNIIEDNEKKHKVLIDDREFVPGISINEQITQKIDESDIVLVFYSNNVVDNFRWVMEEVEYSIHTNKPFVCILLDEISVPPLLKGEEEKLHFRHKENIEMKEIQSFIYKLEGMNFEEIESKLHIAEENLANRFIKHLKERDINLKAIDYKFFNIFDALTTRQECKLTPVGIVNFNLDGSDINASYYQSTIEQLQYFGLVETQGSGSIVNSIKIQNSDFHSTIFESRNRYGIYWKNYLADSIKIELHKNPSL